MVQDEYKPCDGFLWFHKPSNVCNKDRKEIDWKERNQFIFPSKIDSTQDLPHSFWNL